MQEWWTFFEVNNVCPPRVMVLPQRHPSRSSSVSSMRFVNWQRRSAKSRSVELWIYLVYHISVCTFVFQSLFLHVTSVLCRCQWQNTDELWQATGHQPQQLLVQRRPRVECLGQEWGSQAWSLQSQAPPKVCVRVLQIGVGRHEPFKTVWSG